MRVTENMSVGEVIRRYPRTIPVFQIHHVVVCCRDSRPVGVAALRFGARLPALLRMLNDAAAPDPGRIPAASVSPVVSLAPTSAAQPVP